MQHRQPTTIAILGTTIRLSEMILAQLLRDEGYDTRLLEAPPPYLIDGRLDGADVVLFAPGEKVAGRRSFLGAMRSVPEEAASIPLLPLSPTLKLALLDEQAVSVPWRKQFEELVRQIEAALGRAHAEANVV
ncbi:MAG TPA: hypothetical protein VJ827_11920 [Rubrobacter sp.]|nr:hypothetical protein [Rubrobacter sp.]